MARIFHQVMTDHAGWLPTGTSHHRVLATKDGQRWLAHATNAITIDALGPGGAQPPSYDIFTYPPAAAVPVPELTENLARLGAVARLRNPDLWNALATAIIRQVIRASQAVNLYRRFSQAHGEHITLPNGDTYPLFPTPSTVLTLDSDHFADLGLTLKRRTLKAAAAAYLEHGHQWRELPPHALAEQLQTIPRVGPWTARAATADWSNNWALYPHDDLAVRTWARRAAPAHTWPEEPAAFGRMWRQIAGPHLSTLTLLTLAWGRTHANRR